MPARKTGVELRRTFSFFHFTMFHVKHLFAYQAKKTI